jgi:hypothetical protein
MLYLKRLTLIVSALAVVGCGPVIRHPEGGLDSVDQAYGPTLSGIGAAISEAPPASKKVAVFNAPYEDVYRAVVVSTSQSQIFVEKESRSDGVVMGTRVVQARPLVPICAYSREKNGVPLPRKYFYAVYVKELAAKSTQVTAAVKVQGSCWTGECAQRADFAECKAYSTPHWAQPVEDADEGLTRLLTFIRNNLLAAGAI